MSHNIHNHNHNMEVLRQLSTEIDVSLSEEQLTLFSIYYDMMMEKNKVMNLTAITQLDEVITKHFVDSLMIVKAIDLHQVQTVADVGTGAGFPGIPLKIAFPHLKMTLMDSLAKRLKFLDEVIAQLSLCDITTVHGRAEDIGRADAHREAYDLCVSRAVANLSTLSEYCLPLVKLDGKFISYKSGDIMNEYQSAAIAVEQLGGACHHPIMFQLPKSDIDRCFVVIDKIKKTPKQYPRKAGIPSKEPLA